ncbi:enoyl-CoA hydratase [Falsiroseomonas stagni]|uniref:Enoyl-CoA hydratase/carnithine racemase n=1 Tax=Falsiroseomonas stagni DSM 19981 TaxID=1123062 RepID=A0A1I3X6U7_9PROT|nr:enoyl-CoA hydratase [Falsiroseomonas stagni]SFK15280.1 Enoyl-CoA hydratase/carnithine racemase [Falsiroseomonas stagni DSM 19981]
MTDLTLPTDLVLARKADGIGWITLNNAAKRNAITLAMWDAMAAAVTDFMADDAVRLVVMSGAGEKSFAAGADIGEMERMRAEGRAAEYTARATAARAVLDTLEKPLIAMIQGHCIGGGLALALRADLRVASDDSVFGVPAAKLGIAYATWSLERLTALVGPGFAKEMLFTGTNYPADIAFARGLLNRVVPAADLEATVLDYARIIARNAPLSMRAAKITIDQVSGDPALRDATRIAALGRACAESEDLKEGQAAFREKRRPVFQGR